MWNEKQDKLISSLTSQPLVIVLRISQVDLENQFFDPLINTINKLILLGINNIEIAWSPNKNWSILIKELQKKFKGISFGAASVSSTSALELIAKLNFSYAMTPYWDLKLQHKAKQLGQLLVPGVLALKEIEEAVDFGFRIIKLFPASTLGIQYLQKIQSSINPSPFVIAAGGMKVNDLNNWILKGFSAIALGRELIKDNQIDPLLEKWLSNQNIKTQNIFT